MRTTIITAILAAAAIAVPAAAKAQDTTHKAMAHRAASTTHRGRKSLASQAKISKDSATKVALAQVSGGSIKSSELEREHGKLIYSFDITVPGQTGVQEVNVSAIDGAVVATEHEDAAKEAKEAKSEKVSKAHKATKKTRNPNAATPATPATPAPKP